MWPWQKEQPKQDKPKEASFFSTDIEMSYPPSLPELMARSIRRQPGKFVAKGTEGVAMDDADMIKPYVDDDSYLPNNQIGWYASQGFIGYQLCALIAQNWLVNKACAMPGADALRHGYEITVNDGSETSPDLIAQIKKLDRKYKIKKAAQEFLHLGRVFGVRHALPLVDYGTPDATYAAWERPFNIDGVRPRSYRGIVQIDPYWITPELDGMAAANPASLHFYEPTWWRVSGHRIHRSHLIIFRNSEVPDVLKPTYFYGGLPVPQLIAERVYAAERTANEAPMLSLSKRTTVMKTSLEEALANQRKFESRLQWWTQTRDNYGVKLVARDDDLQQFDTSLADFDATIMTQYQIVAAISGVPATKLLGTSPKGFNATGEYEAKSYQEDLESLQENDLTPLIERHHMIAMKSDMTGIASNIEIAWNPVAPMSDKEKAEINEINARAGNALVTSGAIDGQDERNRIIADKDSGYTGMESLAPEPEPMMGLGDEKQTLP